MLRLPPLTAKETHWFLHGRNGAQINFDPARAKHLRVDEWEHREIAVGDRVQFRQHDKRNKIANGSFAVIRELDQQHAKVELAVDVNSTLPSLRSAISITATPLRRTRPSEPWVDRVIVNMDTTRSDQLVNREQFYVSISRGRFDARIYTDNKQALRSAVAREHQKEIALDALQINQTLVRQWRSCCRAAVKVLLVISAPQKSP
jgi:hypothetical protein